MSKANNGETEPATVHVFKPTITWKDSTQDYGTPLSQDLLEEHKVNVQWQDLTLGDSNITLPAGNAPTLNFTFDQTNKTLTTETVVKVTGIKTQDNKTVLLDNVKFEWKKGDECPTDCNRPDNGQFTIHLGTGSLTITKKLVDGSGDSVNAEKDVTFLFQIEGNGKVYNVGVTVNQGASTGTATINNLPAGNYTVTEILVPTGYTKGNSNPADGEVTVSGDTGKITFTNTVTGGDDFTKDDGMVINQFTYENGGWHWNKVS